MIHLTNTPEAFAYRWLVELSVGTLTAALGWLAGRRQRNNQFLSDLQGSIDLLADKNREQMDQILKLREEIIKLRDENLTQSREIQAQSREITALKEENTGLREQIAALQMQLSNIKTITRIKKDA